MKGKEEFPEKELNEIQVSNLSDIDFKAVVIKMFKELRTTGNFMGAVRNLVRTTLACKRT